MGQHLSTKENKDSNLDSVREKALLTLSNKDMSDRPEITCENVDLRGSDKDKFAVVLRNVLTPEECQQLIDRTEAIGYETALVNVGGGQQMLITDYRHSQRCIIDDVDYARELGARIEPFLPKTFRRWNYVELNERLRCLKYVAGDFFAPHQDGSFQRDNGDSSYITLMLYLNEGAEGGQTRFHFDHNKGYTDITPEPGMVLLFQHNLLHEGVKVTGGVKYAVRTDVMYSEPTTR